jgi:hypothetical protein
MWRAGWVVPSAVAGPPGLCKNTERGQGWTRSELAAFDVRRPARAVAGPLGWRSNTEGRSRSGRAANWLRSVWRTGWVAPSAVAGPPGLCKNTEGGRILDAERTGRVRCAAPRLRAVARWRRTVAGGPTTRNATQPSVELGEWSELAVPGTVGVLPGTKRRASEGVPARSNPRSPIRRGPAVPRLEASRLAEPLDPGWGQPGWASARSARALLGPGAPMCRGAVEITTGDGRTRSSGRARR